MGKQAKNQKPKKKKKIIMYFLRMWSWFWIRYCSTLHRSRLDQMAVASLLLEKLGEVVLAVENALKRSIVGRSNSTASMGAFKTGLVVCLAFDSHLQKPKQHVQLQENWILILAKLLSFRWSTKMLPHGQIRLFLEHYNLTWAGMFLMSNYCTKGLYIIDTVTAF